MPDVTMRHEETIGQHIARHGVSRRDFVLFCAKLMVAAPFGLSLTGHARAAEVAREVAKARRLPVIWLHFQDCTGCTETLLRTSEPDLGELILHLISLDYHETLMAAAGKAADAALRTSMKENAGKYVLVVEGSIPRKDKGVYMKIAGKPAVSMLEEVAAQAAAVIGIGSCAAWGMPGSCFCVMGLPRACSTASLASWRSSCSSRTAASATRGRFPWPCRSRPSGSSTSSPSSRSRRCW